MHSCVVQNAFLHRKQLEGVESSVRERNAQGNLLWMWKGMWSPIQTRPKQTSLLPWMLGEETTSKAKKILSKDLIIKIHVYSYFLLISTRASVDIAIFNEQNLNIIEPLNIRESKGR